VRPALEYENVKLMTRARVKRLLTDGSGKRVTAAEVDHDGESIRIGANMFEVACGAINSAALLLRSVGDNFAVTWFITTPP
jgi:choline dehydrogenase-like flavoprotein